MAADSIRLGPSGAERLAALDVVAIAPSAWASVVQPSATLAILPCKVAPVTLVLAAIGAFDRRGTVRVLAVAAVVAALLASGPAALMRVLHGLPLFDFFAGPMKFFYVAAFLVHALAAVGLERLGTAAPFVRRVTAAALAAAVVPAVGWLGGAAALIAAALPQGALRCAAAAVVLAGSGGFLARTAALSTPQPFGRDAFTPLLRQSPVDPDATADDRWIALDEGDAVRTTGMNFGALWGVQSISGVGPLPPWREFEVLSAAERGRAAALVQQVGASRVVVRAGSSLDGALTAVGYRRVRALDGLAVFAVPSPSPHALLAAHVRFVEPAEAVAAARRGEALASSGVLIEGAGDAETGDADGRLELVERGRAVHRWRVDLARPTWLVVREPYYRNWIATVDGRAADVRPAGGFLLAVRADAGSHDVTLRYREPALVPGLVGAALTAIALAVASARRAAGWVA
jgi:hypothetical protein